MTSGKCRKYRRQMADYLAGEMTALQAAELDRHLAGCTACAQEAAALTGVAARLDRAAREMPSPPAGLALRVLTRARETKAAGGVTGWCYGWLGRPALAGAVLAAVFTLFLVGPAGEKGAFHLSGNGASQEMKKPSTGNPGQMSIMMQGIEAGPEQSLDPAKADSWVAVFSGDFQTGQEAAGKLAKAGIRHQLKSGPSGAWITVFPGDLERAKRIIFAPETP